MISLHLLNTIFVSALIAANVMASKIVDLGFWHLVVPAAIPAYAITYLMTDLVGELYGKAEANRTVKLGVYCQLFVLGCFAIGQLLPAAAFAREASDAYRLLLGGSIRIIVASLVGYLVSQWIDVNLFHWLGRVTKGKHKWLRNNCTIVSQLADTVIFIGIAFWGKVPSLAHMLAGQMLIKVGIALIDTPVFYLLTRGKVNHEFTEPWPGPSVEGHIE